MKSLYNKNSNLLDNLSKVVSEIDFINSGRLCAEKNNFFKPNIFEKEQSFIIAKKLRHPLIEKLINYEYVPHDVTLDDNEFGILLYGLNAAGKSSLMKAVGLSIILGQIGYYVPSESFNFSPYNSIFTTPL